MEKLSMKLIDLTQKNIEKIEKLFPNAITEAKDENGDFKKVIDFEILKQELCNEIVEGDKERYQLTWPGKKEAILLANTPINMTLRPVILESIDWDNTQNLYIEGDNLEVLKLLQESYLNKVKCIYIDPPYNTGSDFIYKDDFSQSTDEYLEESGQVDEDRNRLFQNNESNGRFHSDWLSMLYPRLKLARNLLKDDGVIFISIDDNEVHNLRKICDEIFGEKNFIANIVWQKKFSRANDAAYFSTMHDHILCYCKTNQSNDQNGWKIGLLPRNDEIPSGYANPDNDPRGVWTSVVLSAKSGSDKLVYDIVTPSGRVCSPPSGRYWSVGKEKFAQLVKDNRIWFGINGEGTPRLKTFLTEVQQGLRPNTMWFHSEAGHNQEGKQETKALFDGVGVFDGPKPVKLLSHILTIANLDKDSIILDFFSGSSTTAHAVMKLNAEKKFNCKYIMVQLPEETAKESEAFKAGYKNICEIGKERIRRAEKKLREEYNADIDYGFRVYRLDSLNMKDVYYAPHEINQDLLSGFESNIKEDRTSEDLLVQVVLECGLELSLPIETREIHGKKVHFVAGNSLIACFDLEVSEVTIKEIAKEQPLRVVFRDNSFKSDSDRINIEELFKMLSPGTEIKVI